MRPHYTISQDHVRLAPLLPVRAEPQLVTREVGAHDHDFYELCVVWSGTARHQTAEGSVALGRGHLIVVPPGGVHAFRRPSALRVTNVYYLTEWLVADLRSLWSTEGLVPLFAAIPLFGGVVSRRPRVARLTASELSAIQIELEALERERERARPSPVFLKAALLKALVVLSRALVRASAQPLDFQFEARVWAALEQVEELIASGQPFSLRALARRTGTTAGNLARRFRMAVGVSPRGYYQTRRIERAKLLVLAGDKSITQIAHELGFTDAAHFCRTFRREVGTSAGAYRDALTSAAPVARP